MNCWLSELDQKKIVEKGNDDDNNCWIRDVGQDTTEIKR